MTDVVADARSWALLAGAVVAALALLYVLQPRRRRVEVPFGGLWQRVLAQSQARAFGRKWQRLWSFLLLLALAGTLLMALGHPIFWPEPPKHPKIAWSTVLVVDCSASMATLDGVTPQTSAARMTTRLDEARWQAGQLLGQCPADEQILVMAVAGHNQVLSGWSRERPPALQALAQLQVTDAGLDLQRALLAARAMLSGQPGPRVVLVTDAGPPLAAVDTGGLTVQTVLVGPARQWHNAADPALALARFASQTVDDLAVISVQLRQDLLDPDRGTLSATIHNATTLPQPARLAVRAADQGQLPADFAADAHLRRVIDVTLPPGLSQHIVADLDLGQARFAVQVTGKAPQWVDRAPYNDIGLAVLGEQRRLNVLWVGPANQFLGSALQAVARAKVTQLAPENYDPKAFAAADKAKHGIDVVVLDQVALPPPEGMPALVLAIDAPADATLVSHKLAAPELHVKAGDHPLLRAVSFQDTNFDIARQLPVQQGDTVLVAAPQPGGRSAAVMVAREAPVRQVVWGLDLLETDLALRIALPILVANALGWLAGDAEPLTPPLQLGHPWAVQSPNRRSDWRYVEPGKPPRPARMSGGQLLASSERHGIHVWHDGIGTVVARPTMLQPTEHPLQFLPLGQPVVTRPVQQIMANDDALAPWARWLFAAVVALALEWLLYLRRRTV